jgi:hypothetical protein
MNEVVRPAALTAEQLAVLKSSEWFGGLEPAFQQAVLASSRVVAVAVGSPFSTVVTPATGSIASCREPCASARSRLRAGDRWLR